MVTVYTTASCAFCPMVKKFLKMRNVPFEEVDVTLDNDTRGELIRKTGMLTVPVITNGSEFVVGWKPMELARLVA